MTTPTQISRDDLKTLQSGHRITCEHCSLILEDGYFTMRAYDESHPTHHRHQILESTTSLERLNAHWKGYVETRTLAAAEQATVSRLAREIRAMCR